MKIEDLIKSKDLSDFEKLELITSGGVEDNDVSNIVLVVMVRYMYECIDFFKPELLVDNEPVIDSLYELYLRLISYETSNKIPTTGSMLSMDLTRNGLANENYYESLNYIYSATEELRDKDYVECDVVDIAHEMETPMNVIKRVVEEAKASQLPLGVSVVNGLEDAFRVSDNDENDSTISKLHVHDVSYELVETEDNDKYVFSSSNIFRKGFKVGPGAEQLVFVNDVIMVVNEDGSYDELLDLKEAVVNMLEEVYKQHMSLKGKPLVYQYNKADKPVITCEIVGKWYGLYVVAVDGTVTSLNDAENPFEDWIDHCPRPDELVEYAEANDMYVDEQSLEMMIGRIMVEKHPYTFENRFEYDNIMSYN